MISDLTEPVSMIIFGGTGDLSQRMLMPALFKLFLEEKLPQRFEIIALASTERETAEFREIMTGAVEEFSDDSYTEAQWQDFAGHLHYVAGRFDQAQAYQSLGAKLDELEEGESNRLFYLATPPQFFDDIIDHLGKTDLVREGDGGVSQDGDEDPKGPWRRVIIEKPFGSDLKSAQALNRKVHMVLNEDQVYRIDHFLAKETVQNILVFRFGNTMFEPIWNRNYVDHVQITVAETVDIGQRGGYYDQAGVLRDMFQNHLMQLLALVAMEPPASFAADAVRDEKVKTMKALRPLSKDEIRKQTVRGQYKGYREAQSVDGQSQTATFAALELYIDNWRWQDVPFYLRSGKTLAEKTTEIIIQFKRPPHQMFPVSIEQPLRSNYLALCIQPHEGFHQRFEVKIPGRKVQMRAVNMDFHYDEVFDADALPEAYETLLFNALEGDMTLFTRADGIEAAWRAIDPIIEVWHSDDGPALASYERGSWGPQEADDLLQKKGRKWRHSCGGHEE